jgi:hypothetical protein
MSSARACYPTSTWAMRVLGIGLNGVLEYGSIGVLGFECITPLLHHSSTRFFTILEPGDI